MEGIPFGKYHLLRKLTQGGMAEVFLACAIEAPHQELVLKKLLPHLRSEEKIISMFLDEGRIMGLLSHANIVRVLDLGQHEHDYYIAMEYVRGRDLGWLARTSRQHSLPIPLDLALEMISQIGSALAYIHSACDEEGDPLHIIHRDISPHNVLLSIHGELKLSDFGIALGKHMTRQTSGAEVKGKFAYVAPEMLEGEQIDYRADLFSLGIVSWELLAGDRLFRGPSPGDVLLQIRECHIPSLPSKNPELSCELEEIIGGLLRRLPEERYASAHEFLQALQLYRHQQNLLSDPSDLGHFLRVLLRQAGETLEERGVLLQEENSADTLPGSLDHSSSGIGRRYGTLFGEGLSLSQEIAEGDLSSSPPPPCPATHPTTPPHTPLTRSSTTKPGEK